MFLRTARHGVRSLVGAALLSLVVLTGCSEEAEEPAGTASEPPTSSEAATEAVEEEPYLPVPDGVELTAQGSELSLGDTATVAYEPRQDEVAVFDLTVISIEKATFKLFEGWKLTKETRRTTPYFVRARVENVGDTDLGGRPVPLYAVDGTNKLIEASTFASTFKPCPSTPLPKKFPKTATVRTCLVYLAPDRGEISAASFRPTEAFDPITWTGKVTRVGEKGDGGAGKGDRTKGGRKDGGKKDGGRKKRG